MGGHSFLWYTKWLKTSLFDNGVGGTVYFLLAKRIKDTLANRGIVYLVISRASRRLWL
jgi:hypothetical protein